MVASASQFDETAQCFGEYMPVVCVDAEVPCPPVITLAVDENGDCFSFGGCLPVGYTEATAEQACPLDSVPQWQ
jgi:hypothetical protein